MPKKFDLAFLAQKRFQTDPLADSWAEKVLKSLEKNEFHALYKWLVGSKQMASEKLENLLQPYFEAVELPSWAQSHRMLQGAKFFRKHKNIVLHLLGVLSLPYCYAAKNGVQVLAFSQKLQTDTFQRLKETAIFTIKANSFDPNHSLIWKKEILKIRLLHAIVRKQILRSTQWQTAQWGEPINQEDMAGTNLTFSYIVLRGMRKLNINFSEKEAHNFLHLWNVIGFLLGIEEELLPYSLQEAFWLDRQIATTQFQESKEGKALTKALISTFYECLPSKFLADLAVSEMRFLLGEKVANMLAIPQSMWNKHIITEIFVTQFNRWFTDLQAFSF